MKFKYALFYNNQWNKSVSGKFYKRNLVISKKSLLYAESNEVDCDNAIKSAKQGLKTNKKFSFKLRQEFIYKIYKEIKKNYKVIAKLETLETGKNLKDAKKEILHSAKIWLHAYRSLKNLSFRRKLSDRHKGYVIYEPVGILALLIPWNFPFVVMSERLPFMIAAGNSIIIKPSEYAAQSILYLMNIIKKIKLPKGIVNLLTGSGNQIGSILSKHKDINLISFTGSTKIGKKIMKNASSTIKRMSLELGGKNSIIVMKDADLNRAVKILIESFTGNAGQSCVSTSRLLIDYEIKEIFLNKLINNLKKIKNFKKLYGYISTPRQLEKIIFFLKKNKNFDKNIIFGNPVLIKNNFVKPIIYDNLPETNIFNKQELFAPILSVNSFKSTEEAILLSNNTKYGLSAVICGTNKREMFKIAKNLDSGRIWINETVKINYPSLPIGGFKQSGLNRELGHEGLKTYSEIKSIIQSG